MGIVECGVPDGDKLYNGRGLKHSCSGHLSTLRFSWQLGKALVPENQLIVIHDCGHI